MAPALLANLDQGLSSGVELSGLNDLGATEGTITPSDANHPQSHTRVRCLMSSIKRRQKARCDDAAGFVARQMALAAS